MKTQEYLQQPHKNEGKGKLINVYAYFLLILGHRLYWNNCIIVQATTIQIVQERNIHVKKYK